LNSIVPHAANEITPRKQDAIHRALLTGLLGNVGARASDKGNAGERGEYDGVRGKKFHLFPGSTIFRARPPWVMAAELVETSRVYARTLAEVRPGWIERAAAHLVKREWADPHWRPDLGRVLAFERVTLHGLTLIARRKIHYGPIDPKLSREIFIHHALVLGEYDTDASYFRHNRDQVEQVQQMEAKARRQDVLVDPQARFAFYDARIPRRIYTAQEFEKWRHVAEKQNPRILFMSRDDLMLHPALGVTQELYPDSIAIGGMHFPLEYRFEPGDRADGITVTIPLGAIDEIPGEPFAWLVAGFRSEMFLALIRTLPKTLRVKFVPARRVAAAAARQLQPCDGPPLDALARYLGKTSGEPVRREDFQPGMLPDYLRMNFRVVDGAGNEVVAGRDLGVIRRQLGLRARDSFAANPPPQYHRDGLTTWDFGELPRRVEIAHQQMTLNGYPALVDSGNSVSLRLFDSAKAADAAHRAGLRRLFIVQLGEEFRYVERSLADLERLCRFYDTIGACEELNDELIQAIVDRAMFANGTASEIRTREAFAASAEAGWRRLAEAATEITQLANQVLEAYCDLHIALSAEFPPLWADSIRDMRDQLSHLIHRGFLVGTPFPRLRELPRYLRGIGLRLKKLADAGLTRDTHVMAEVRPLWEQYKRVAAENRQHGIGNTELEQYRWMVEELRVSLFAQELKAADHASVRRLQKRWDQLRSGVGATLLTADD